MSNPTYQLILESVTFLQPEWTLAGILVVSQGGTGCIAVVLKVLSLWLFRKNFDTVISIKPKESSSRHKGITGDNSYL